jgi:hypothetical protein
MLKMITVPVPVSIPAKMLHLIDPSNGILIYSGLYNQDSVILGDLWLLAP